MEIKTIQFKPAYAAMNLTTKELEISLNQTLGGLDGYKGSRVKVAGTALKVQIAFDKSSCCIIKNKVAAIIKTEESYYRLSDDTVNQLDKKFIRRDADINIFEVKDRLIVDLDVALSLQTLIPQTDEHIYQIGNMVDATGYGIITIFQFEKQLVNQVKRHAEQGGRFDKNCDNKGGGNNNNNRNQNQGRNNNQNYNRNQQRA